LQKDATGDSGSESSGTTTTFQNLQDLAAWMESEAERRGVSHNTILWEWLRGGKEKSRNDEVIEPTIL
jgi:hypothetical protein